MKAAKATTTPTNQGLKLGRQGSEGRAGLELPTEEFSVRELLMPSACSAMFADDCSI
jgi:hypothetical protein